MDDGIEKTLLEKLDQNKYFIEPDGLKGFVASVLIILVKVNSEWNIIYTKRTNDVSTHQGEVSFPGGAFEIQDKSLVDTALRETWEEIGVLPNRIKILGGLNPMKTVSNIYVYPFVGILDGLCNFKLNVEEVERIFYIPIRWLKDKKNSYEKDFINDRIVTRKVLHYKDYDNEHLWGLTARITQELLALI